MYRIGTYNFINKEVYDELVKSGLIREYDVSPEFRKLHDEEAVYNKNGLKIKLTLKEQQEYIRSILKFPKVVYEPIKLTDEIPNIWIKGLNGLIYPKRV